MAFMLSVWLLFVVVGERVMFRVVVFSFLLLHRLK